MSPFPFNWSAFEWRGPLSGKSTYPASLKNDHIASWFAETSTISIGHCRSNDQNLWMALGGVT